MSAAGAEFYNFWRVGEKTAARAARKAGATGAWRQNKMPYSLNGVYPDKFQILSEDGELSCAERGAWTTSRPALCDGDEAPREDCGGALPDCRGG